MGQRKRKKEAASHLADAEHLAADGFIGDAAGHVMVAGEKLIEELCKHHGHSMAQHRPAEGRLNPHELRARAATSLFAKGLTPEDMGPLLRTLDKARNNARYGRGPGMNEPEVRAAIARMRKLDSATRSPSKKAAQPRPRRPKSTTSMAPKAGQARKPSARSRGGSSKRNRSARTPPAAGPQPRPEPKPTEPKVPAGKGTEPPAGRSPWRLPPLEEDRFRFVVALAERVLVAAIVVGGAVGLFLVLRGDEREDRARNALAVGMLEQTRGIDRPELNEGETARLLTKLEESEEIDVRLSDDDGGLDSDLACGKAEAWRLTERKTLDVCVLVGPDSGEPIGSFTRLRSRPRLVGANCSAEAVAKEVTCRAR